MLYASRVDAARSIATSSFGSLICTSPPSALTTRRFANPAPTRQTAFPVKAVWSERKRRRLLHTRPRWTWYRPRQTRRRARCTPHASTSARARGAALPVEGADDWLHCGVYPYVGPRDIWPRTTTPRSFRLSSLRVPLSRCTRYDCLCARHLLQHQEVWDAAVSTE